MEKNIKAPADSLKGENFFVSLAPHLRSKDSTQRIMLDVLIALLPAFLGSVYYFGARAAAMVLVCVASCVISEYIFQKAMKKPILIGDLSAVVTGVLIAFNVPAKFPFWMAIFGCVFAMVIIKGCFGGIGGNFVNPALGARLVLMASWTKEFTSYVSPDGLSGATPLQIIKSGTGTLPPISDMIMGNIGGVIGETSSLLIFIGFIYLIIRKVIHWEIPVIYFLVTAIFLPIFGVDFSMIPYELFGGGLCLGAVFMATDYATTPMNKKGRIIFAIGCGFWTALIRTKASLPEGVSYSIVLMNVATPLIDKLTRTEAYGEAKK